MSQTNTEETSSLTRGQVPSDDYGSIQVCKVSGSQSLRLSSRPLGHKRRHYQHGPSLAKREKMRLPVRSAV